ncbi:hypothetical protein [Thalassospira indica]|uniref:RiboL-PSP-HEPN domain-containing protein n=1 Tax=Thalassospira indica TaxID=1891279 RepID=A0ABM6XVU7_9PROT|nr:hypothetical protein [Thalassospira indica]AXO13789.1 hypothetical protein DY252_05790 [Thalassospira indica]OAZ14327.1 hypothetical protein TH15_00425 [Thalassospira profundimaris]
MLIEFQAESFLNAYHVLKQHEAEQRLERQNRAVSRNKEKPHLPPASEIYGGNEMPTGVVDFVCLAFSVELYLKALHEVVGEKVSGHEIEKLFNTLPQAVREQIFATQMHGLYGANWMDYRNQLKLINDGFVEFRYFHEKGDLSYHQGFALGLIDAIKKTMTIYRSKPD